MTLLHVVTFNHLIASILWYNRKTPHVLFYLTFFSMYTSDRIA